MTGVVAIVAMLGIAVSGIGAIYAARAQAQTAADAAALAAAVSTYPAAAREPPLVSAEAIAGMNGASVVRCECRIDTTMSSREALVVVMIVTEVPVFGEIRVGGAARAEFDPAAWLGG